NHDGRPDLVVWTTQVFPGNDTTRVDRRIAVLLNQGGGIFSAPAFYWIWSAHWSPIGSAIAADLDLDGNLDLVACAGVRDELGGVVGLRGSGDGTFQPWFSQSVS